MCRISDQRPALWIWIVAGLISFLAIAFWALAGYSAAVDRALFLEFALWARSSDMSMIGWSKISLLAEPSFRIVAIAILVSAFLLARRFRTTVFILLTTASGGLVCSTIKALTARSRPTLLTRLDDPASLSFPSGHAWNGAILYSLVAMLVAASLPRERRFFIFGAAGLLVIAIGLSRIPLGVHWPSDILAGWIGGITWLMICCRLSIELEKRYFEGKA